MLCECHRRGRGATLVSADAGEELREPKRLDEVVVATSIQPGNDVELVVTGGQDQDGEVRARCPQAAAHVQAVDVWQTEVEDNEPYVCAGGTDRSGPVREPARGVSVAFEHAHQPRGDCVVVLDHKDAALVHIWRVVVDSSFDPAQTFANLGVNIGSYCAVDRERFDGGPWSNMTFVPPSATTPCRPQVQRRPRGLNSTPQGPGAPRLKTPPAPPAGTPAPPCPRSHRHPGDGVRTYRRARVYRPTGHGRR